MTRREWLTENPPPRAAKSTQQLLDGLNQQMTARNSLSRVRQEWQTYKDYHAARQNDPMEAALARQEVDKAAREIAECDKQLQATADVPVRIQQLTEELKHAANCPQHHLQLHRSYNRPEDMYTCEVGPHHLLWTRVTGAPQLLPLEDLNVPGLDYPMTDGKAISRAQWLASHPPRTVLCPMHGNEVIEHRPDDRIDVFRCKDAPDQLMLWTADKTGQSVLAVWDNGKALPALEEAMP